MLQNNFTTSSESKNKSFFFSISIACMIVGVLVASIISMREAQNIAYMILALIITLVGVFMFAFTMREEKS